jgi:hypothetical protein
VQVRDKDSNPPPDIDVYIMPASMESEAEFEADLIKGQTNANGAYNSACGRRGRGKERRTRRMARFNFSSNPFR